MFGRRKREEAAAEAAREVERRALFAKLAERPEHICPFLGLAGERTGYVDGISDEHRCFAFGDPAPLSAEQQTRVCQERGYGNCPRYLRGVLVIPTEELEALRKPRAPMAEPAPPPPPEERRRRRGLPALAIAAVLLLLVAGGGAAFLLLGRDDGTALVPTPSATIAASPTPEPSPSAAAASETPAPTASPTGPATPAPEATPVVGDTFAFYEVQVGPSRYTLYQLSGTTPVDEQTTSFGGYSFAQAEPVEGSDEELYWLTLDGDLAGWAYRYPDSGDFRIRAVFMSTDGERRSLYLEEEELDQLPEATPAPIP